MSQLGNALSGLGRRIVALRLTNRQSKNPKDNSEIETFNQTLEYEWLYNSNLSLDPEELNPGLTKWLIEYSFNRPHQSLGYLAPVEYIERERAKIRRPVLPMWSASIGY